MKIQSAQIALKLDTDVAETCLSSIATMILRDSNVFVSHSSVRAGPHHGAFGAFWGLLGPGVNGALACRLLSEITFYSGIEH